MDLTPVPNLVGLSDALKSNGIPYSKIQMASMQRGYEWVKDNLLTFFNDLVSEIDKVYPEDTHYRGPFLGVMILTEYQKVSADGIANEPKTCEIVDGQQRTTSSFVLISILRDYLQDLESTITKKITDEVPEDLRFKAKNCRDSVSNWVTVLGQFLYHDLVGTKTPRLETWSVITPLLNKTVYAAGSHVKESGVTASDKKNKQTKKFAEAVVTLRSCVKAHLSAVRDANNTKTELEIAMEQAASLISLADVSINKFYLVKLYTPNPGDSAEVFLSLNSKGKALSSQDIIKAHLINSMNLSRSGEKTFSTEWSNLQKRVDEPNQYLRISWIVSREEKASPRNISDKVTKAIVSGNPVENSQKIWSEFNENSILYEELLRPKIESQHLPLLKVDREKRFTVSRLRALADTAISYRIILLKLLKLSNDSKTAKLDANIFDEYVKLLYVLAFAGRSKFPLPQKMEDHYIVLANKLTGLDKVDEVLELLRQDAAEALDKFTTDNLGKDSQLLILHALEESVRAKKKKQSIGWKDNDDSIEHTAPQNATPEWLLALSLSASQEREYKGLVQNIGNLALLNRGQNSGIKQKPWVDPTWPNAREQSKRAAYNNADFDITKDLAVIESWDEEVILRREVWILKTVKEVFNPYSGSPELYVPFS